MHDGSQSCVLVDHLLVQKNTEFSGQCGKQVEDYLECLHHKKEVMCC